MPGFLSSTTALTVYKIDNPAGVTADKLKQFAFQSIDDIPEPKGWGWVNIDDMFDTEWRVSSPEKGGFMCFAFRTDTRKVSPSILKKHLAEALRLEAETSENGKISRSRRKALKEEHAEKLRSQTEPVPSAVDVALDTTNGLLYVGTTSASLLESFEEYMVSCFSVKPVRLTLAGLNGNEALADDTAVEQLMRSIYANSLSVDVDGHSCTVAEAGQATLMQDGGSEVTVKNAPDSANAGLEAGLSIKKMKMQLSRDDDESLVWELTLNHDFSFPSLKTPKVTKEHDDDPDPDAVMLEKLYLIEQAVNTVLTLGRSEA